MLGIGDDLPAWCTGGLSFPGVEVAGKVGVDKGFFGVTHTPVTCGSFLGVAGGGASHMSTSLSESSSMMAFSDLCWTEMACGPPLADAPLLSEFSSEVEPSPSLDWEDSGSTTFLDVSTAVVFPVLFDKEVVGISVSLGHARGLSTVVLFASGCSGTGALAFLFPRSRLVSDGLLKLESDVLSSLLLVDEP